MIDLDHLPRDPAAIRRGIATARAMLSDPENRSIRRRLRVLIEHLQVLAEALEARATARESGQAY